MVSKRRSARGNERRGYALLVVLWVLTVVSSLSAGATVVARQAVAQARNRTALTRAQWLAEGCLERARASLDDAITVHAKEGGTEGAWREVSQRLSAASAEATCSVALLPIGAQVSVNTASEGTLRQVLATCGIRRALADSLAAAVVSFRRNMEHAPRDAADNGSDSGGHERTREIVDVRQLWTIAEFRQLSSADSARIVSLVTVEKSRLDLGSAQPCILESLPGITSEVTDALRAMQSNGRPPRDMIDLAAHLPARARDSLMARAGELSTMASLTSDAWLLVAHGYAGEPRIDVTLEVRLVAAGHRAAVTRRRGWIE